MTPHAFAALLLSLLPLAGALNSRAVKRSENGVPVEIKALVNNPNATNVIPGNYMVVLKSDISPGDLEAMRKTVQTKVKRRNAQKRSVDGQMLSDKVETLSINSWHAINVECTPDMVKELVQDPQVKGIEANSLFEIPELRSADPIAKRQAKEDVPCQPQRRANAAEQGSGNPCLMCVLDTGVNDHSEFKNRLLRGKNFSKDASIADLNGHGTHVAGLAAGATLSEASNCMIMPIKILAADGAGDIMSIVQGLRHCRDVMKSLNMTSATANLSVGGGFSPCVNAAIEEVAKDGVVVVAAAGNERRDARTASPASAKSAIAVGAVDSKNTIASFSDFGPKVEIFAPGVDVCSASNKDPNGFRQVSGTSQASPQVASDVAKRISEDKSQVKPNATKILESIQADARKAGSKVEAKVDGKLGIGGAVPLVLPDS